MVERVVICTPPHHHVIFFAKHKASSQDDFNVLRPLIMSAYEALAICHLAPKCCAMHVLVAPN